MGSSIQTRFLVLSDTHSDEGTTAKVLAADSHVDVLLHCGDLTEESKLTEFRSALHLLKGAQAALKLVIAGNHDWALDDHTYDHHATEYRRLYKDDQDLFTEEYGTHAEARALFDSGEARAAGIVFLDEGTHNFTLPNGANLTVYASPYTCSSQASWGFQFTPDQEHVWSIPRNGIDIAVTHSPPKGILDRIDREGRNDGTPPRAGSPGLFAAIARARPKVHCFGHIHESWGARKVTWNDEIDDEVRKLPHFTAIDNDASETLHSLAKLRDEYESPQKSKTICEISEPLESGRQTLFVNAAVEGLEKEQPQPAFIIEIPLSKAVDKVAQMPDTTSTKTFRGEKDEANNRPFKRTNW